MILFKGKQSFDPATLNNRIHTYFFADYWARRHIDGDQSFSYEAWIRLIENVAQINKDYKDFVQHQEKLKLFKDWGVYGDGMALSQFYAIGQFDPENDDQITAYQQEEYFPITSKLGQHKSSIAQLDTDSQLSSKWFALLLQNPKQKTYMRFKQDSYKNTSTRILNDTGGKMSLNNTDWFLIGQKFKQKYPGDKLFQNQSLSKKLPEFVFFKSNQYRYNHQSKLSNHIGYFTDTKIKTNAPNMQGWRFIKFPYSYGIPLTLLFKSTKKGLLLDISNIIQDTNDEDKNPIYPQKMKIKMSYHKEQSLIVEWTNPKGEEDIEFINNRQAGLLFIKGIKTIKPSPVSVQITFQFDKKKAHFIGKIIQHKFTISGVQKQYFLFGTDGTKKALLTNQKPFFHQQYLNLVQFDFFCTRYGQLVTGQLPMKLTTENRHDTGGMDQYLLFDETINKALKSESFKKKYISIEHIKQSVYLNKLDDIVRMAKILQERFIYVEKVAFVKEKHAQKQRINLKEKQVEVSQKQSNENGKKQNKAEQPQKIKQNITSSVMYWRVMQNGKPTEDYFQMRFQQTEKDFTKVRFENGKATVRVRLNIPLDEQNNPRRPVFSSLVTRGNFTIQKEEEGFPHSDTVGLYGIFYEIGYKSKPKSQWVTDIGPTLKKFALIYPSMQNIVNIYDFKTLKMPAMKRVFDIEDENNSRYMPSTREISAIQHRNIRKWLYQPIYNSKIIFYGNDRHKKFVQDLIPPKLSPFHSKMIGQHLRIQKIVNLKMKFKKEKRELVSSLKNAFKIELTTIPLYLSAMISSNPDQLVFDIIRTVVKDEMKHLFIVSNMLNAVHEKQHGNNDSPVPYTDDNYIPKYPLHKNDLPGIFMAKDQQLSKLLVFDILPCIDQQILKFCILQLPGQLDNIVFQYRPKTIGLQKTYRESKVNKLNAYIQMLKQQLKYNPQFKTIGEFYSNIVQRFWSLYDMEQFINKNSEEKQKVKLFSGDPTKQFTYLGLEGMAHVTDLSSALNQFRLIVEEGQGMNLLTTGNYQVKKSHFLKFIEIYTGCTSRMESGKSVLQQTENKKSMKKNIKPAFVKIILEDDMQKKIQLLNDEKRWSQQIDKEVNEKVKWQFENESIKMDNSAYTDAYARVALKNAYEIMMKQLDYVFNVGYYDFIAQFKQGQYSQNELKKMFELTRRTKMENSIARMRQVRLHADKIILYARSNDDPTVHRDLGSRPDFNISFK